MLSRLLFVFALLCSTPLVLAIDRDEAAARVQQQTGGRVLAVERGQQGGQPVFKVKVLTPSGDIRIVVLDANSGARR